MIGMKHWMIRLGITAAAVSCLYVAQGLLQPKYTGRVTEGSLIEEYYREEMDHDLLVLGDCEVYANLSPATLWREYGIVSYIRGSASQMAGQSYYLLRETLRYETPSVVLFNVAALKRGVQEKETYNRMTLDGMRWTEDKWNAIRETKLPEESMISYLFPILRYHSRWTELEKEDFLYFSHKPTVSHNGYYMRCDVLPAGTFPAERRQPSYEFSETSWKYLNQIEELCRENGIRLVLMKAPSIYPAWQEEYDVQIRDYAKEHGLLYLNALNEIEEIGLDFSEDTYDGGMHLNVYGAEKFSGWLGKVLSDSTALPDRRNEDTTSEIWEEKLRFYDQMKAAQEQELQENGFLHQFKEGE